MSQLWFDPLIRLLARLPTCVSSVEGPHCGRPTVYSDFLMEQGRAFWTNRGNRPKERRTDMGKRNMHGKRWMGTPLLSPPSPLGAFFFFSSSVSSPAQQKSKKEGRNNFPISTYAKMISYIGENVGPIFGARLFSPYPPYSPPLPTKVGKIAEANDSPPSPTCPADRGRRRRKRRRRLLSQEIWEEGKGKSYQPSFSLIPGGMGDPGLLPCPPKKGSFLHHYLFTTNQRTKQSASGVSFFGREISRFATLALA